MKRIAPALAWLVLALAACAPPAEGAGGSDPGGAEQPTPAAAPSQAAPGQDNYGQGDY